MEGARLPSDQLEFEPYLCLAGPVLSGAAEEVAALGTGLPGDKHCCLCYALLNKSISMLLKLDTSWFAPRKLHFSLFFPPPFLCQVD